VIIRIVTDESDYVAAAAIAHAAMPDYPESAETLRERDRAVAAGGGTQVRWLAEGDAAGEVLAAAVLGHFTWCADPTIKGVGLRVVPSARGRGIGRALHDTIIAAAEADATRLLVGFVDSRESRSCAFAEAAGYRLIGRALESHIEPHQVDLERFAEVAGNARRSGITIDRLADLSREVPD